jgi:hypothetical protein
MNFFRKFKKFWTISAFVLWKRFSGNEWIKRLDECIAILEQMESTWNEVNNDPLSYSRERSDLEMLIPSWNILQFADKELPTGGHIILIINFKHYKIRRAQNDTLSSAQKCTTERRSSGVSHEYSVAEK